MMSKKDKLKKYSVAVSKTISVLASDEYEAEEQARADFDCTDLDCEVHDEDEIEKYWDKLETKIWRVVLFKEDKKGNQKFYQYDGDHSSIAEQMYDVENEYLNEIEENEK